MKEFRKELERLEHKGLLRKLSYIDSRKASRILINRQSYINFSSNDYLGLSEHPEIIKASVSALKKYGFGSGGSRLLSGSHIPHKRLEERIARFKGTESALIFNTGYAANTGIIPAIAAEKWTIFSDELNHASIIDGIRLSKAEVKIYRHRDADHLEELLKDSSGKKLIVTDTVFSMDGDIAPLNDIVFLSKKYRAMLMIDDAHATGVLGSSGRGSLEHFGIRADDIIQMGTLSKALGCFGAFVAGSRGLVDFLINRARSFMYSTSLPPAVAEAGIKAIDIVDFESAKLRKRVWDNRQRLYKGLCELGYNTLDSETPIIPVLTVDAKNTINLSAYFYKNKIFAPAIRPPTVSEGKCRIRFSVTAMHTKQDIDRVLNVLKRWGNL
ncbi:MAG: 8-amino-7-oxononanoate synthase [Nitrospirae bacterium]|nr:8-amino-7-oxononanoate synthase [Nitrospirota bacterium]